VLIVEDDLAVQESLQELFSREGYEVVIANNGGEAIDMLERDLRPCCVLLDLLMPGIVGHEVLSYLGEPPHHDIPVGIMTGSPHLAPTNYPVFTKPLEMKELLDFVGARCPLRAA
jgi:CheY-like chemotaxis protein